MKDLPPGPEAAYWTSLTDDQRLTLLKAHPCCRHCGSLDVACYCMRDD